LIVDEDIEPGLDAVAADDVTDATGGLSVYKDPNVQSAVAERNKLNDEYRKYYDDLTAKIMAQRTGPSFSERMFQLSAALAQPTTRRGFGAVLANVAPVLQAQERAEREGMDKRRDALSALKAAQLGQRAGLANQDVTTALAMAKLAKQGTGLGQWSDKFGRYVPKDRVVPVSSAIHKTGRRLVTYSDGSSKLYGLNGNPKAFEILDGALTVIGQGTE
jgi:hypothetical protein